MPDTTPQNLKMIRDYVEIRSQFNPARLRGVDRMLADALAMIDALEAQIRDLTKPEEDVPTGLDPNCPGCHGRGYIEWKTVTATGITVECVSCIRCDPNHQVPLQTLSEQ